jgi:hypothetical protein
MTEQHNFSLLELVFTKLILQILHWIYGIAIDSRNFILELWNLYDFVLAVN